MEGPGGGFGNPSVYIGALLMDLATGGETTSCIFNS